jgi:UPF0755 protein
MKIFYKSIFFYAFCLIVILSLGYFLFLSAPMSFKNGTIVNIVEGTSLRGVSLGFKQQHIIRSRVAFEAFIIIYGGEKHIMTGDYLFENKLPVFEIARRIGKGEHHLPPVKVTIPEGFDVSQIASAFALKLANFDENKFIEQAKDKEGYLFPDTYFFLTSDNEQDVLIYMRKNFDKKIAPVLPEIVSLGKTEDEIITMASIIEGEAKGDADRGFISGILWKRIAINMPLQADAAPITYKERGLPENPVSNPGLAAIKAAMYPKSSPYLFYLHDSDGNIHYAKTFEEHKVNKLKYLN